MQTFSEYSHKLKLCQQEGAVAAEHLQRVEIIVYSDEDCEALHPFDPPAITSRQYHLCAGAPEGGRGQCRVCKEYTEKWIFNIDIMLG